MLLGSRVAHRSRLLVAWGWSESRSCERERHTAGSGREGGRRSCVNWKEALIKPAYGG